MRFVANCSRANDRPSSSWNILMATELPWFRRRYSARLLWCGTYVSLALSYSLPSLQAADSAWLDVARASITTQELTGHVNFLADDTLEGREAGSRGGHAAAKYIVEHLQNIGLEPAGTNGFFQVFRGNERNILAVLPGSDPKLKDEYILVGAHYDHVGYGNRSNSNGPWGYVHNGADDNASGVSTVLELIDALTRTEHRPRRSILFAFWDGEEKGLLGSAHWARNPTVPLASVRLGINVDMVGRLKDKRIEVGGSRSAVGLRKQLSTSRLDEAWLDFSWEYKENSDHWTFYQAKIPSIYLHTGLHDDYHTPSDDVEKINVEGIRLITSYLLEKIDQFANAETLPKFRNESRLDTPFTQKRVERPLAPLASRLPFRWETIAGEPNKVRVKEVLSKDCPLVTGDRVVGVNGLVLEAPEVLETIVLRTAGSLPVTVERQGFADPLQFDVVLSGTPIQLGLSWREDAVEPQSVYVTRVVPHSPAAAAGFVVNDRIYGVEGQTIAGRDELLSRVQELLAADTPVIHFEVESRGVIRQVEVPLTPSHASSSDATL
jgi:hypothetical protein